MVIRRERYHLGIGILIFILTYLSCREDLIPLDFPAVSTDKPEVDSLIIGSVRLNGRIDPKRTTSERIGFAWGTNEDSLLNVWDSTLNAPLLNFEKVIPDLKLNQIYFYRAFAEFSYPDYFDDVRIDSGVIRSFTLGIKLTVPPEISTINNTTLLKGHVEGLDDDTKVVLHGYIYNSDPGIIPQIGDGVSDTINLGIWNGQDSLESTRVAGLKFNTSYQYRAWMKTQSQTYYYSNTGIFEIHDGWEKLGDFPEAFQEGVAVSDGTIAYIIGGCQDMDLCNIGTNNNFVFTYDSFSNSWNKLEITPLVVERHNSSGFILNNEVYFGFGQTKNIVNQPLKSFKKLDIPGQKWDDEPIINGSPVLARSRAVSFCIDGKAYFGTGWGKDSLLHDFWEFDPLQGTCRKMEDLPVKVAIIEERWGRRDAMAFTVGQFGYVMCGITVGNFDLNDVWKFSPPNVNNPGGKWEWVEFFPGARRSKGVAFTIGDKAFVGLGYNVADGFGELSDIWEFIPVTEPGASHFQLRVPYAGVKRENAVAFTIGNKAYVGSGQNETITLRDFWVYTPKN